MKLSRRAILKASALGIAALTSPKSVSARNSVTAGAIRWDAWYGTSEGSSESFVNPYVDQTLGPQEYRARAPWFAGPKSKDVNSIDGNSQTIVDREISYASQAGLKYWAYCWYGAPQKGSPMQNAWALHQSSAIRNSMNWCMLLQFSRIGPSGVFAGAVPTWVNYLQQPNYQTVLGNRPLVYLYVDGLSSLDVSWHGSWGNVRTALNSLRIASVSANVGDPYIVIMYGNPFAAADIMSRVLG